MTIVYYEGNEKQPVIIRLKNAFKAQMPAFLFMILFIVFTYIFASRYTMPEDVAMEVFGHTEMNHN